MASELYQAVGQQSGQNLTPNQPPKNPQAQCREIIQQRGLNVPANLAGDPQAIMQHLMQSGQIPRAQFEAAGQRFMQMFGRGRR